MAAIDNSVVENFFQILHLIILQGFLVPCLTMKLLFIM